MPDHPTLRAWKSIRTNKASIIKRLVLAMAIIEPAMTIPQIYKIWSSQDASGVSGSTWGMYILAAIVWLLYGLQLKDKPLIISSTLWIVTEVAVLVGVLLYS